MTTFPQVTQNTSTPMDDALASVRSPDLLRCELQNASYVANLTYENGAQDIQVSRTYLMMCPTYRQLLQFQTFGGQIRTTPN